jgi:hypothetical protein
MESITINILDYLHEPQVSNLENLFTKHSRIDIFCLLLEMLTDEKKTGNVIKKSADLLYEIICRPCMKCRVQLVDRWIGKTVNERIKIRIAVDNLRYDFKREFGVIRGIIAYLEGEINRVDIFFKDIQDDDSTMPVAIVTLCRLLNYEKDTKNILSDETLIERYTDIYDILRCTSPPDFDSKAYIINTYELDYLVYDAITKKISSDVDKDILDGIYILQGSYNIINRYTTEIFSRLILLLGMKDTIKIEVLKSLNILVKSGNIKISLVLKYVMRFIKSDNKNALSEVLDFWIIIYDKKPDEIINTHFNYVLRRVIGIMTNLYEDDLDFLNTCCKLLEKMSKNRGLIRIKHIYIFIRTSLEESDKFKNVIGIEVVRSTLVDNEFNMLGTFMPLVCRHLKDSYFDIYVLKCLLKISDTNFESILPYLNEIISRCTNLMNREDKLEILGFCLMRSLFKNINLINNGKKELINVRDEAFKMYMLYSESIIKEYISKLQIYSEKTHGVSLSTKNILKKQVIRDIIRYIDHEKNNILNDVD